MPNEPSFYLLKMTKELRLTFEQFLQHQVLVKYLNLPKLELLVHICPEQHRVLDSQALLRLPQHLLPFLVLRQR